ncbi:endonuclease domain-containing protein [Arthrobacter sp. SAFR-044]|uniref:endonuclease domain-containing protein n=1 Tax=Arthrobacter sp. SAFR-044 TaxID=3387278 RepID=UPI003F7B8957
MKPGEVEFVEGIWISTKARTWLDMARQLPLNDLVAMGDELIRIPRPELEGREGAYSTVEDLRGLVARHPNLQGVVRARQALDLMRVGSDSAPETFLRLAMLDAGLPEPELQVGLRPGDPRAPSADLGFRQRKVAVQYDGGHHLLEPQRLSDRRRDKAFEAAGWTVIIVDNSDQEDGFAAAIKKIKRAFRTSVAASTVASGFAEEH